MTIQWMLPKSNPNPAEIQNTNMQVIEWKKLHKTGVCKLPYLGKTSKLIEHFTYFVADVHLPETVSLYSTHKYH